ncbi:MAG: hypothetical protein R3B07_30980 [Polyangiaceae bacterium]
MFFMFLTQLQRFGPLSRRHSVEDVIAALYATTARAQPSATRREHKSLLTLILTDGEVMAATQELYFSTYRPMLRPRHLPVAVCGVRGSDRDWLA